MAIVKSLYDKNANIDHWAINDKEWNTSGALRDITDPSGGKVDLEITSIPSPWARIDLIKSAFNKVVKEGHQIVAGKGNIYDKMVSETLDVGQIFFSFPSLTDHIEIIEWDKEKELTNLVSGSKAHRTLAQTLKLYLDESKDNQYHHDRLSKLYLLRYKKTGSILGMTSPTTLFCSSANDLSFIKDIHFGENTPFSGKHVPLRDRDPEYVKWLYALSHLPLSNNNSLRFNNDFPEVFDYIKDELGEAYGIEYREKKYEDLYPAPLSTTKRGVAAETDSVVQILDYTLRQKDTAPALITDSDFEITDSKHDFAETNGRAPLVLPNLAGNTYADWKYTYDKWGDARKTPDVVTGNWWNRILPQTHTPYPYLSIDDFLEEQIIRPYAGYIEGTCWNSERFFDGNYDSVKSDSGYLLPIKNLFFKFFSIENLKGGINGKKIIEMKKVDRGCVSVTLRIPVKNGFVEYNRRYEKISNDASVRSDASKKRYYIVNDYTFDFLLFPNIRFIKNANQYYRAIIARSTSVPEKDAAYNLEFCDKNGNALNANKEGATRQSTEDKGLSKCMVWAYDENADGTDKNNFDYIRIHRCARESSSGIVIPNFKKQEETQRDRFVFAIDFGTTNTHILYSVNGSPTSVFDVTEADKQLTMLNYQLDKGEKKDSFAEQESADKVYYDFMPSLIKGGDYFPLRTALNVEKRYSYEVNGPKVYVNANVAFNYGKNKMQEYNEIITNLKWRGSSRKDENMHLIEGYIDSIMLLLRNKVILNDGRLEDTKIVWFYPVSMPNTRMESFTRMWKKSYEKYFGDNTKDNLIRMTESTAPYYNYEKRSDVDIMATVDIGGGTTDIVWAKDISQNREISAITSFRFAANAIFSNGFNDSSSAEDKSGIVRRYENDIRDALEELKNERGGQKFEHLLVLFDELADKGDTSEMAAFFFSLIETKNLPGERKDSLNYELKLFNDCEMKIVFVIFFSAIIYHIAQLMKATDVEIPDHISFSGNGSKTVGILSNNLDTLGKFATLIFERVYGASAPKKIVILHEKEPKKVTCDGGIKFIKDKGSADIRTVEEELDKCKKILKRIGVKPEFFDTKETYQDVKDNEEYKKQVVEDVKNYFKCVFDDLSDFICDKLLDPVAIEKFKHAREICLSEKQLTIWLNRGIRKKTESEETSKESKVEEPFFFYPIVGALKQLADDIHDNKI